MIREKEAPEASFLGSQQQTAIAAGAHLDAIVPQLASEGKGVPNNDLVVVIDRRMDVRFDVHRRAVDEWGSIIGLDGLGLYATYCCASTSRGAVGRGAHDIGGAVAQLQRLLVWVGLIEVTADGVILVGDPPARTRRRMEEIEERLQIAISTDISPVWLRGLACVKGLLRADGVQ